MGSYALEPAVIALVHRYEEDGVRKFTQEEWHRIFRYYDLKAQTKQAERVAHAASFLYPEDLDMRINLIDTRIELNELQIARDEVNALLSKVRRVPQNISVIDRLHNCQVLILLHENKIEEADRYFHQYIVQERVDDEDIEIEKWYSSIRTLYMMNLITEALHRIDEALCLFNEDWILLEQRGHCLYKLERYEELADVYRHMIGLDPYNAGVWEILGETYCNLGQTEKAKESYRYALAIEERQSAYEGLAQVFSDEENFDEAVGIMKKCMGIFGESTELLLQTADYCMQAENTEYAEQLYSTVLKSDADNVEALLGFGYCLGMKQDLKNALVNIRRAVELDETNPRAWFFLSETYHELKMLEKSLEAANRSLQITPDNGFTHFRIGCTLLEVKKPKEALTHLLQAKLLDFEYDELDITIAIAYFVLKDYDKFYKYYNTAVASNPEAHDILVKSCPDAEAYLNKNMP